MDSTDIRMPARRFVEPVLAAAGYHVVRQEQRVVEYVSSRVRATLTNIGPGGAAPGELNFYVELLPSPKRSYEIRQIVEAGDVRAGREYRYWGSDDQQELAKGVERLAALLQRYGASALAGDTAFFERMDAIGTQRVAAFAEEVRVEQERPKAEAAFREKRFGEAVRLYEGIEASLTPTEQRKLEIARKKARES